MNSFHRLIALSILATLPLYGLAAEPSGDDIVRRAMLRRQARILEQAHDTVVTHRVVERPSARSIRQIAIERQQSTRQSATSIQERAALRAAARRQSSSSASSRSSSNSLSSSSQRSIETVNGAVMSYDRPSTTIQEEIWRLTNLERTTRGLPALTYNAQLEYSAQTYADKMNREDFFSHTAPDGQTLKERMHDSGYYVEPEERPCGCGMSFQYGENIALGQRTAESVVEDWMNSPSHRAAMLSEEFVEFGAGKSGSYWVQHFGVRREM